MQANFYKSRKALSHPISVETRYHRASGLVLQKGINIPLLFPLTYVATLLILNMHTKRRNAALLSSIKNSTMEARKDKRFKKRLLVRIYSGISHFGGITGDISNNGMFIRGAFFPNDIVLNIALYLPGNKISFLLGTVKRNVKIPETNWLFGMGLQLIKKDHTYQNLLKILT
jgi:hypothetical protein